MKRFKSLLTLFLLLLLASALKAQTPCTLSLDSIYLDTVLSNCNHLYFKYKYSGGTPASYKWTYGDGNSCGCFKPHNAYNKNATYTVCGKIQDINGCADSLCLPFTVNCSNPCDLSEIGIYSYDTVSYNCRDYEFVAWISANAKRKVWLFGDGDSANTTFATHTYFKNGQYQAKMIVQDSIGCADTANVQVNVDCISNLPCPLSILSMDTLSLADCWTKQFTAKCSKQPLNAWWQYGDNVSGMAPLITQHTYKDTGLYAIALYVKDSSGCADTMFTHMPVYCSKNNQAIIGINEDHTLLLYPMPVTDELQIAGDFEGQVIITDIKGKIVLQSTLNQAKAIPCGQLKAGLYLINLATEKRTYKSKFIKL